MAEEFICSDAGITVQSTMTCITQKVTLDKHNSRYAP